VLVVGMHRSGTSAVAGVLGMLGLGLPKHAPGADGPDEKGRWEPEPIVKFHDATLLPAVGSRWDDWRSVDLRRLSQPRRMEIGNRIKSLLRREYRQPGPFVLEDPRICRFVSLYIDLLEQEGTEPRFILPFRSPLDVIASLQARDSQTPPFASLLWLRHVLDSEAATRFHKRAFLSYERLLADWRGVVDDIGTSIDIDWPVPPASVASDIDALITRSLQHQAPSRLELPARSDLCAWVNETYEACRALEAKPDDRNALCSLERVRAEFAAAEGLFGDATLFEIRSRTAAMAAERNALLAAQKASAAQAERQAVEANRLNAQLADAQSRIAALKASVAEAERRASAVVAAANERIAVVFDSTTWRATAGLRLVLSRIPAPIRVQLRRMAKGDWRELSPLSIMRRLRARRSPSVPAEQPGLDDTYLRWVREHDTLDSADRSAIRAHVADLTHRPRISVLLPVHEAPERHLCETIESVLGQLYPYWELCIADDASTTPHLRDVLDEYRRRDRRIRVIARGVSGGVSAAGNSALKLAAGEFVALLNQDDVLAPHALYAVAVSINDSPTADLVYSDEDKIDDAGRRFDPHFKPEWNPERFYAQDFVGRLGVYRTSLVRAVGGFRVGFEGSESYDLMLRAVAATRGPIVRVPHVLYHRRWSAAATPGAATPRRKTAEAARRAVAEHLSSVGERASVVKARGSFHRVVREPPDRWPLVSVIIPTRDHVDVLRDCMEGLLDRTDYPNREIIIADNESCAPETAAFLAAMRGRGVKVIPSPGPFNFSRINNKAVQAAAGEILLFLNNDVSVIHDSWLKEMIVYAMRPDVGAVGARLLHSDGTVQHAGVVLGLAGVAGHIHCGERGSKPGYFGRLFVPQDISCVTAACMAVPRKVFEEIGGFDEVNLAVAYNDVDLCIRIREAGYRIIWTPYAELYHLESKSRGSDLAPAHIERFRHECAYMTRRWASQLATDPFFSPNLSLAKASPEPAFPPRHDKPWRSYRIHGSSLHVEDAASDGLCAAAFVRDAAVAPRRRVPRRPRLRPIPMLRAWASRARKPVGAMLQPFPGLRRRAVRAYLAVFDQHA
jgi:GT2 family glycosyltransferase